MAEYKEINSLSYRDAGVDIDAGAALVEAIKPMANSTHRAGVMSSIGGFGGLFDLKAAGYRDPVLVAATDGVGTKLNVAIAAGKHDTVGIDLVAMCVNDLVVQGAEPLFFLDYLATGKLDTEMAEGVIAGIAEGCRRAGAALIGGETAEMPGMYGAGDYDLAGFAVGAVERDAVLTGESIVEGDVILGLASDGLHSNGFSLVRRVVGITGSDYAAIAPFEWDRTLGEALLVPTRIYVKSCLAALRADGVKGMAHITGGGLSENIPRVLPPGLSARLDASTWPLPGVFPWLAKTGGITVGEMARTFNCGIGMVVITGEERAGEAEALLKSEGEAVYPIGRVEKTVPGAPGVIVDGMEEQWMD